MVRGRTTGGHGGRPLTRRASLQPVGNGRGAETAPIDAARRALVTCVGEGSASSCHIGHGSPARGRSRRRRHDDVIRAVPRAARRACLLFPGAQSGPRRHEASSPPPLRYGASRAHVARWASVRSRARPPPVARKVRRGSRQCAPSRRAAGRPRLRSSAPAAREPHPPVSRAGARGGWLLHAPIHCAWGAWGAEAPRGARFGRDAAAGPA